MLLGGVSCSQILNSQALESLVRGDLQELAGRVFLLDGLLLGGGHVSQQLCQSAHTWQYLALAVCAIVLEGQGLWVL